MTGWGEVLDRMELDVTAVEALLAERGRTAPGQVEPWSAPADLGPIPPELRPRADAVLERQLAASLAVVAAMTATSRQAIVAGRMRSQHGAAPSYLDRSS
jgi:hypothetical protein